MLMCKRPLDSADITAEIPIPESMDELVTSDPETCYPSRQRGADREDGNRRERTEDNGKRI